MVAKNLWLDTQFSLERIPQFIKLKFLKKRLIKPFINIYFENKYYQVKMMDDPDEIFQTFNLRFNVFYNEFSTKKLKSPLFPYDLEHHDFYCDHLIVKDKIENKVIACYRLLSSNNSGNFSRYYSESEFHLEEFLGNKDSKLELGRACVHKDYRNGMTISLLWKGLLAYAKASEAKYLFGCSSFTRKEFPGISHFLHSLESHHQVIKDFKIQSKNENVASDILSKVPQINDLKIVNSLLGMYLLGGAKMSPSLAYDEDMDCMDIFTLLDLKNLPPHFERRFS
jgi:putative hemolysin